MTRPIASGKISTAPPSVYYLLDFITSAEEQLLIDKVLNAPKPKWIHLKNRRLQNWGGIVSAQGMIAEPLPVWLTDLFPRFHESGVFEGLDATHRDPNHCLVNEYLAGQGIMPHKDGPAYLPTVATVSLSSHCVLEFYKCLETGESGTMTSTVSSSCADDVRNQEPEFSILVQPRSLLVLKEDVYNKYMHGIRELTVDDLSKGNIQNLEQCLPEGYLNQNTVLERSTRISLTFRIVQKTMSSKKLLFQKR
ncbi:Alpha-ketoglutarate-dependent dioxygenase alkB 6 [Mortierella polycephala]|uniref:Alpha-ketoglutarate-dependent dioxygenase alkB 6 n=1 Tax=Mortierella polycephala TaxID=41804 RepID=A0A9P6PVE1_9FUNG|nr:Alpha-ketoglutarate-dependent dioxygenase alkB 6 [Mortierella polycephala]